MSYLRKLCFYFLLYLRQSVSVLLIHRSYLTCTYSQQFSRCLKFSGQHLLTSQFKYIWELFWGRGVLTIDQVRFTVASVAAPFGFHCVIQVKKIICIYWRKAVLCNHVNTSLIQWYICQYWLFECLYREGSWFRCW